MYDFISRAVFGLHISEEKGIVRISGIRADYFLDDITKVFNTSRVSVHMFNKATRSYVEFYSFFAIDVEYIVRKLSVQRTTRLGKRGYLKILDELVEKTWLTDLNKTHPSIFNKDKLKEIKFDLLKHQSEFIDYYDDIIPKYSLKGILMGATPGSGKTISSIAVACAYESDNVIIVAPKNSVFRVWEKTLLEDMNVKQTVWVQSSGKPMPPPDKCRWYVFHYESLDKAVELSKKLIKNKCTIILDESHNLNEMKSLRTVRFVEMCRSMPKAIVVELSGTPLKAMGSEAIPLISAIDPLFTPRCAEKFKKIYGREAKAATAILANRLGILIYRVNKEESKIQEPIEHTLYVKVPNASDFTLETISKDMHDFITERTNYYNSNRSYYTKMYYDAIAEFELNGLPKLHDVEKYHTYTQYINEFKKKGYNPLESPPKAMYCNAFEKDVIIPSLTNLTKKNFRASRAVVKYVNLKIRGECLGTVLSRARTDCNLAILDNLDLGELIDNAEKKTLIFTSYVEIVKATEEKLTEMGYKPLSVYAATNSQLPSMVKQYGSDETINPMIATYQSLSTAVPLTMANRVILLNAPFRIHEKEQTIARANRLGQDKTVDVYNVFLDTGELPNISTRSGEIMEWSRVQVNMIMGIEGGDELSVESMEQECVIDLNDINPQSLDNITMEHVTMNTLDPVKKSTIVPDKYQYDKLINDLVSCESFIHAVNKNIKQGKTLNTNALSIYSIINANQRIDNLGFESHMTSMKLTVLSLEAEKQRKSNILSSIIKFIGRLIKAVINFFKNTEGKLRINMVSAIKLKKRITSGNANVFEKNEGDITVTAPKWLVRGGEITPKQHLIDLKWQYTQIEAIKELVNTRISIMVKSFNKRLTQIHSTPGLNQTTDIMNKLTVFKSMMYDSSVVNDFDNYDVYTSAPMMGGRVFKLNYPKGSNSEDYLMTFNELKLRTAVIENEDVDDDDAIPKLNSKEAIASLDYIIDINKTATHMSGVLNSAAIEMRDFVNKSDQLTTTFNASGEVESAVFDKQVTLMLSGLKVFCTFSDDYLNYINRLSLGAMRYVTASATN